LNQWQKQKEATTTATTFAFGNDYGKTLPFTFYIITRRYITSFAQSLLSRFSIPFFIIIASPPLPPGACRP